MIERERSSPRKRVVLLDVDGTLVDSNDAHARAWAEALEENGYRVELARIRACIGEGGDKLLPDVIGVESDSPEGKRISERRGAIFRRAHLPTLRAFDGARALLEELRARDFELVVATSAPKEELSALLKQAGLDDLIGGGATASDANQSKPDPDIIEAALRKAGCRADEATMIGDTPYDAEAAKKAGVDIVALRCGGWGDEDLREAIAIYDDARDLLAHLESSPLGASAR